MKVISPVFRVEAAVIRYPSGVFSAEQIKG